MADTVRERLMQALKQLFLQRVAGQNGALLTWDVVTRQPIGDSDRKQGTIVSLVEGRERTTYRASNVTERLMSLTVEFELRSYQGEDYATYANDVLGDIQATIQQGVQLGGLALYVQEASNQLDIQSGVQKIIGGLLLYDVKYRHITGDPTRAVGE